MSKMGKTPIALPKGVTVTVVGKHIAVKGPRGEQELMLGSGISVATTPDSLSLAVSEESREMHRLLGLYRALVANLVKGVSQGFKVVLEMNGVGYRAAVQGKFLDLSLGFSHPVQLVIPAALTVQVEKQTVITIEGNDKKEVGDLAAEIRRYRPPEPYKGKGVRYQNEYIRRKQGKSAAKK